MIHIPNRTRLDMYSLDDKGDRLSPGPIASQLLLNYCYGHGESSLLLCPYGPIVNYVNHNQTRANVRLQWSPKGNHNPELLEKPINEWKFDATAKLAMELVAIREIAANEEVLLDYGDEWESAWNHLVLNWKPVTGSENYVSAAQLNKQVRIDGQRLRTVFEESREQHYPVNVDMQCDTAFLHNQADVELATAVGRLDKYLEETDLEWLPCEILRYKRNKDGQYLYAVYMYERTDDGARNNHLLEDLPWLAFHFVDRPYTSDAHLPNAFRHDIRIPNEIFPEPWKNRRNK
jgi:SET domain